jgi:hypothetical protein
LSGVIKEENCTLNWTTNPGGSDTNIDLNNDDRPYFVAGPSGNYYLDQLASPAIDAGSTEAKSAVRFDDDFYNFTTDPGVTISSFDAGVVDMGYHYKHLLAYTQDACRVCDFVNDGIIDLQDLAEFMECWLLTDASGYPDCAGKDLVRDDVIDAADYAAFSSCWLIEDTNPPIPVSEEWSDPTELPPPPKWAEGGKPAPVEGSVDSIFMQAELAIDGWWGGNEDNNIVVWYKFDRIYPDSHDSGWITEPTYTDTGLAEDTSYEYVVYYTDVIGNVSEPSVAETASTDTDNYPPVQPIADPGNPDPVQSIVADWAYRMDLNVATGLYDIKVYEGLPSSSSLSTDEYPTIMMAAEPAEDLEGNGVEYWFVRTDPGGIRVEHRGPESTWTDGNDENARLVVDVTYTYTVTYSDLSNNEGDPSVAWDVVAEIPPADDLTAPPVPAWLNVDGYWCANQGFIDAGLCDQIGTYWIVLEVSPVVDDSGLAVEYFFRDKDDPSVNSGWTINTIWRHSVSSATALRTFEVAARDQASPPNESGWNVTQFQGGN